MKKEMRLNSILNLVSQEEIKTQEELCQRLQEKGMHVTQATVSRDIRDLKLIKVPGREGHLKYAVQFKNDDSVVKKLQNRLRDAMVKMEAINYLILIKTLPGHAHSFGSLLDAMEQKEKIGTVCGNDTCLVICRSPADAYALLHQLESYQAE